MCLLFTITLFAQKPKPFELIKPADLGKIIPRDIPRAREAFTKARLNRQATQNKFLQLNKGNFTNEKFNLFLPTKFDYRESGAVTSVKDQNPYGTCWAFSLTAAVESAYLIQNGENLDLAEQDLINCGCRRNEYNCGKGNGKNLLDQLDLFNQNVLKTGWGVESTNPYKGDEAASSSKQPDCTKRCTACNETVEKPYGVEEMEWITTDANGKELGDYDYIPESVIKKAMLEHGPLDVVIWIPPSSKIFGMSKGNDVLDEKFTFTKNTGGIEYFTTDNSYLPKNFSTDTDGFGGHLMLLVGWDDSKSAWLVKNSWGTGWGNDGYGWIKYRSNYICNRRLAPLWVSPLSPNIFSTTVWKKGNQEEEQVYDWSYENFAAKDKELYAKGWRLHYVQNTVKNNQVRYNAIWRKSNEETYSVYGWAYADYKKKYDEIWKQGWRLKSLNNFVFQGKMLYSAIWVKSNADEIQIYAKPREEFLKMYNDAFKQGWRIKTITSSLLAGTVFYTASFEKSNREEFYVFEWTYDDYRKKYDEIWKQGWRLKTLNTVVIQDGTLRYNGFFVRGNEDEIQLYNWPYEDFRKKQQTLRKSGYVLSSINLY